MYGALKAAMYGAFRAKLANIQNAVNDNVTNRTVFIVFSLYESADTWYGTHIASVNQQQSYSPGS